MKIVILTLSLFFASCASTSNNKIDRDPAQSLDDYYETIGNGKHSRKVFKLWSYVQVAGPKISAEQLSEAKRTCRAQMVIKILHVSENLKALYHPNMNLKVSNTDETPYSRGKFFNFSLVGTDGNSYTGFMYIDPEKDENKISSNGNYSVLYCHPGFDNWTDFAQIKDARGTLVFSSSYALRSMNGENINERGSKQKTKRKNN